jgi:hypothetical protein
MGSENRRHERIKCYAKVLLTKTMTPGYIRDLNATGCHISFVQPVQVKRDDKIEIKVVAGGDPQDPPFAFPLRVRWVKMDGIYFSLGGDVGEGLPESARAPFAKLAAYYQGKES